jgi:hypothetical protein
MLKMSSTISSSSRPYRAEATLGGDIFRRAPPESLSENAIHAARKGQPEVKIVASFALEGRLKFRTM